MAGYLTRNLRTTLTYWSPGAPDGFGGTAWAAPVSVKGRWENREEMFIDAKGDEVKSAATVYVVSDVVLGGYLFNGSSTAADPLSLATTAEAKEIRGYRKMPTLKDTAYERKCYL
tara:strand:+ start:35825 stop:36169 length:345 start_codon:yes stop_codon:yes gene_type:complete